MCVDLPFVYFHYYHIYFIFIIFFFLLLTLQIKSSGDLMIQAGGKNKKVMALEANFGKTYYFSVAFTDRAA